MLSRWVLNITYHFYPAHISTLDKTSYTSISSTGAGAVIGVPAVAVSAGAVAAGVTEVGAGVAFAVSGFNHLGEDAGKMREAGESYSSKKTGRMTTKEATASAQKLGFEPTNYRTKNGQKVFLNRKTKAYISQDIGSGGESGSHNGGVWKQAKTPEALNSKSTRMGTYDENLIRIGD